MFILFIVCLAILAATIVLLAIRPKKSAYREPTYSCTYASGPPPDATQRVRYVNQPVTVVNEYPQVYTPFYEPILVQPVLETVIVEQPIVVEETSYYNSDSSSDATGYVGYDSNSSSDSFTSDSSGGDFGGGGAGGDW